jgi:hypothetical protein
MAGLAPSAARADHADICFGSIGRSGPAAPATVCCACDLRCACEIASTRPFSRWRDTVRSETPSFFLFIDCGINAGEMLSGLVDDIGVRRATAEPERDALVAKAGTAVIGASRLPVGKNE